MDYSEIFSRLTKIGRLPHGFIFHGASGDSEKNALMLACFLETGKFSLSDTSLNDFRSFSSTSGIGIEDVRQLKDFLFLRPVFSSRRTAFISRADRLTREAQNALLKISEDYPPSALIILSVPSRDSLLPTLRSRFQSVFFPVSSVSSSPLPLSAEVQKFLSASPAHRSLLIKNLAAASREDSADNFSAFLETLIIKLSGDIPAKSSAVKQSLQTLVNIKEYQVNRRLQLEALGRELKL